ncbi:NRDE family protein [Rhizohabitans arisaemae]|uniref:NRDE family protein n=1 Tax=Rhizohabitans arisaemae TaxID=2720610 RepID=UPI0024B242A8|nr:NRDE family protein [Rhizohabitans arisaemae]
MCTVIVSVEPHAEVPVLLAGVRDEFLGRPWAGPARHWPRWPGLVGGLDRRAGGTWLAVDPGRDRVAALLNGRGADAPAQGRRSRGDLALRAAAEGVLPDGDLSAYDPFHLLLADRSGVRLCSWDGAGLAAAELPPGTHMVVNGGWEREPGNERVAWFLPRFAGARPTPAVRGVPADQWGRWLTLTGGDGLPPTDPRALVVRHELGDGSVWGTGSISLVALTPGGVRYDFCPDPADPASWYQVDTAP